MFFLSNTCVICNCTWKKISKKLDAFVKVTNIKTPQTQEDEFIEIQSETGTAFQRWTVRKMTMLQQVCNTLQ